jgi:ubiquinone/menaquinone biosynthesis C-methylase UbiE
VKELEDYSWFPPLLRNFQTDFIGFVVAKFHIYDAFINYITTLSLPMQSMTDLCSGSGEPAISIFKKSNHFSHLTLSDKFPRVLKQNEDAISYDIHKTDVLEMEFEKGTCYTMFNAFHHFGDDEKLKMVRKIQKSDADAFIVEILEPTLFCLLKIVVTTTLGCFILTPFIHPFSLKRMFFTYILPINILTITFDGIVSVLKSRSIKQYQCLLTNTDNSLNIFQLKNGLNSLIVIQIKQAQ